MDFENVISLNKVTKNEEKSFEARHSGGTCLKTIPKTIRNYDGKNLIYKKGLLKHLKINLADMQQSGLQKHRQIRKEDLDEHVARIHSHQPSLVSSIQLFICATCDEGFIQKSDLTNHTRVHYGLHSDEQQETLSLKQNDERKNLLNEVDAGISAERYIKGVKEKQQILYMCSKCEKKFSRIVDLCKHFNNIHIRPFWCVICDIGFIQKSALNNHIRVHHDLHPNENIQQNNMLNEIDAGSSTLHLGEKVKKKKLYNCRNCEKKFTRIVDLDEHFNSIHTSPFLCTICEKGFIKKSALINHMKVHCGLHPNEHFQQNDLLNEIDAGVKVNQWSFSCPACDKKFYRKVDFDKHTSSILHFCCITCNKGFIKKSDFRNHMHVHHPKEQQGMLSSKTHIERNNQFNEGKEHTSTENLDVRENQQSIYTCPKCEEQFNRKVDLDNHATEIHFNKEPSICGICRKFFEQKSAYTNHMRVHTGLHPNEQQEILSSKTNILQNYLLNGGKDFKIVCRKDIEEPHTLTGVIDKQEPQEDFQATSTNFCDDLFIKEEEEDDLISF